MADQPGYHEFVHVKHDGSPDHSNVIRLPRISDICKTISNPNPLMWWAMRTGLAGVAQIASEPGGIGILSSSKSVEELEAQLKKRGLRHDQQRDDAAKRGQTLHKTAEALAAGQAVVPQSPWEEGLVTWWTAHQPDLIASEQFVWYFTGPKTGFSGSYDTKLALPHPETGVADRIDIVDYKTRKPRKDRRSDPLVPYESEWLQTAGYWLADGGDPSVGTAVLTIDGDGNTRYNMRSPGEVERDAEAFLKVFEVYQYLNDSGDEAIRRYLTRGSK